jgi:hypothetical protein
MACVMLGSPVASTATVRATKVATRDLRVRCIVIKLPCLLSAERDGKSKSTKGVCRSQYLTVSAHLDGCRTIRIRTTTSMRDLALYHFAWISCKSPRAFSVSNRDRTQDTLAWGLMSRVD